MSRAVSRNTSALYYFIVLGFGLMCAIYYQRTVVPASIDFIVQSHNSLIHLEQEEPLRFRILSFALINPLIPSNSPVSIIIAYIVAHLVAFPALFATAFTWFRKMLDPDRALAATAILALFIFWMFQSYIFEIYSILEAILLCVGFLLLFRRPQGFTLYYSALVFIASTNRETAVVLVLAYAVHDLPNWRTRNYWLNNLLFGCIWAAVFIGLRLIIGSGEQSITLPEIAALNLGGSWWTFDGITNNLPYLPIWAGALLRYKYAAPQLRRLALVAIPYAVLFLVFGIWREIRLLLPLLIILLPIVFSKPAESTMHPFSHISRSRVDENAL